MQHMFRGVSFRRTWHCHMVQVSNDQIVGAL